MASFWKKIPTFRSGQWWKAAIASGFGLLALLMILGSLLPSPSKNIQKKPGAEITPTSTTLKFNVETTGKISKETPPGNSSPTLSSPHGEKVKVLRVVDGDTIKIESGEVVRYIGIDTPETVHPEKPVQCYGKEASDQNRQLVEGREVRLEKDISETDKYDRLLRYVWLDDLLVNEYLVREGYAYSSTYPPDVKYQDRFIEAQRQAREEKKGLWGEACNPPQVEALPQTDTPTQSSQPTVQPAGQTLGSYTCDCSKTCSKMSSCTEAQYQLNVCGCQERDADHDGIACDADCQ